MIYTEQGWAIYDARMTELTSMVTGMSLRFSHKQPLELDFRLGMICLTPSMMMSPDEIVMAWTPLHLKVTESYALSMLHSRALLDIHLSWQLNLSDHPFITYYRIFRNAALISVTKGGIREYYDKGVDKEKAAGETKGLIRYRVEAVNLRNEVVAFID